MARVVAVFAFVLILWIELWQFLRFFRFCADLYIARSHFGSRPLPKTLPSKAVVLNTAGASAEHFKTRPSKAVVLKTGGASAENFKTKLQKRLC